MFARGFRNPFRFGIDPTLGLPVTGEVGYNNYEEVDVVQRGGNYGWPCWEAGHPTPGYSALPGCAGVPNTTPLVEYPHGSGPNQGDSAVGGIVYTGNSYPDSYRGAFFFGDYVSQQIWTVHYDDKGNLVTGPETPPVFTGMGGPVKFGAERAVDISAIVSLDLSLWRIPRAFEDGASAGRHDDAHRHLVSGKGACFIGSDDARGS